LGVDESASRAELASVVARAAKVLDADGTIIVPTDTVYGVAARIDRPAALLRLFDLKGRDHANPLAVLVADASQARSLVDASRLDERVRPAVDALMDAAWPGALTLVLPRSAVAQAYDLGGDPATIGVRCPSSTVVRSIAGRVGPLVTTRANRRGDPTPTTASAAANSLAGSVGLVIDAGPCTDIPSTVLDATAVPFRVLRVGPVDVAGLGLDEALLARAGGTASSDG
jgi:L-threonylcarbamoyladenylate synthase